MQDLGLVVEDKCNLLIIVKVSCFVEKFGQNIVQERDAGAIGLNRRDFAAVTFEGDLDASLFFAHDYL